MSLSSATAELGKVDESTAQMKRALAILERAYGPQHPMIATLLGNLGKNLAMSGRFDEAMAAYDRAMAIVKAVHGPKHAQVAVLHARRGVLLRRQRKNLEGLSEFQAALAIDQASDPDGAATGRDLLDIADCLASLDRLDEARRTYERALAVLEKALGANDMELAGPLAGLGAIELELKHTSAAVVALDKAVALLDDTDTSVDASGIRFDLARALWDSGRDRSRARKLAERAEHDLSASQDENRLRLLPDVATWLSTRK
jgi:tetratricopeptide (TPR) repeat protein